MSEHFFLYILDEPFCLIQRSDVMHGIQDYIITVCNYLLLLLNRRQETTEYHDDDDDDYIAEAFVLFFPIWNVII